MITSLCVCLFLFILMILMLNLVTWQYSVSDAVRIKIDFNAPCKFTHYFSYFSLPDPLYTSFHDEEWGVPVHDDKKLFELLVLSQALAELSWPTILNNRDIFRYFHT